MDIALWVAAGLLAAASAAAALNKLLVPRDKLLQNPQMAWAGDFSQQQIRLISVAELAGAIGVILPWALDTARVLTPLAAIGLILLQAGALKTHLKRGETQMYVINALLIGCGAFVAVGRFADL
jgi:hypothetical protein